MPFFTDNIHYIPVNKTLFQQVESGIQSNMVWHVRHLQVWILCIYHEISCKPRGFTSVMHCTHYILEYGSFHLLVNEWLTHTEPQAKFNVSLKH
jgi:hypothetical protein